MHAHGKARARPGLGARAAAVGLLLLLVAATLPAAPAAAAGDWIVAGASVLEGAERNQTGSVIVQDGGQLAIRNATLSFNLSVEGGSALQVDAGGSLVLENCTLRSLTPGLHWNFIVSGHLEVRNCDISGIRGDSGLGGLEINGGDAVIEDSTFHDNKYYGIFIRSGSPTIRRTTLETQSVGISVLPGATPTIEDVVIRNATSIGLKIADSHPVVRNLTVLGSSNFAIGSIGATLDIHGCRVAGGAVGLDAVQSTSGSVDNCDFSSVETGVRAQDSPVSVTNSSFVTVATGVNATRSAVEVRSSSFTSFSVGVLAEGAVDGVFGGSATGNTFCGSGTAFETHTDAFFVGDNTFCTDVTSIRVFHLVTLEVLAPSGVAATLAHVDITDADGTAVFSGVTDNNGKVTASLEEYRTLPTGERHNETPHGVRIDFAGQVTRTTVNATSEATIQITLAKEEVPTGLPFSREGLYLMGALFAVAAGVSAFAMRRASRRRKEEAAPARKPGRRGPRSGR